MLECLVKRPTDATDGDPVLVLLHGRGADMGDLQGLSSGLPPHATLVTPQAPHSGRPWGYGMGWAWYRYLGENRAEAVSLKESLAALDQFMEQLPTELGFEPGTLILGGFSQGGTTSLAYALTRPGSVGGIVVLSGFLANREELGAGPEALGPTPIFWAHGTQDPAVPFHLALEGWKALEAAGGILEAQEYSIGHWVAPEELVDLSAWLGRNIPGF